MKYFLEDFSKQATKIFCQQADETFLNQPIVIVGWVQNQRDHGHLCFIDLKDFTGVLQIVLNLSYVSDYKLSHHNVIAVKGTLLKRPEGSENKKISTGLFELKTEAIQVLSESKPLPIDPEDDQVRDSLKLKYRYLSLRSNRLQKNLRLRDQVSQVVRDFLHKEYFTEIDTPILYKTTPEGARDYLVPSRIHTGQFYSLVQSPQILKQLLMVGGMGRYFQIAKCFRDEDLRSDRQPEFSQIDLEMSFVDVADVIQLNEKLVRQIWREIKQKDIPKITTLSYQQALESYGSDKPDLRANLKLQPLDAVARQLDIQIFKNAIDNHHRIKGLAVPPSQKMSKSLIDRLTKEVKKRGAKGLLYLIHTEEKIESPLPISQKELTTLYQEAKGEVNGVVFILADQETIVNQCFSFLISELAQKLSLVNQKEDSFVWVTEFPLFDVEEGVITSCHHPFTAPDHFLNEAELIEKLHGLSQDPNTKTSQLKKMGLKAKAYDLICNGQELAGGSIRNHQATLQEALFQVLGLSTKEVHQKFGFFIEALQYGTPPHGGIAWGLDRLIMILSGTSDIREVIAFPKSLQATCLMSEAPSQVSQTRLNELGIALKQTFKQKT